MRKFIENVLTNYLVMLEKQSVFEVTVVDKFNEDRNKYETGNILKRDFLFRTANYIQF